MRSLSSIDERDWDRLLAASATRTVFQTQAWLGAWWDTFGRGRLLPIAVHEEGALTALAPLYADEGMVFFVGSGGSDYLDFLGAVHRPQLLRGILELARQATPGFVGFRFYLVPDDSPTAASLAAVSAELGLTCCEESSLAAPALRFRDWPEGKRRPSEKKSLLRHERGLRASGTLEIEHVRDPEQVTAMLPDFFQQHVARWADTPYPSLFLEEQQREFYHRISERVGARGWLRFTRMAFDGEPAAYHFGFAFDDAFLWYKPAFAIELARRSPGEVLLRSLLLQAQEESLDVFDFGLGDESFKQRFATRTKRVRTWGLYPHHGVAGGHP